MLGYWLLFLFILIPTLTEQVNVNQTYLYKRSFSSMPIKWSIIWIIITLAIGFRHKVGGDWDAYLIYLSNASKYNIFEIILFSDPAYQLINYIATNFGGGIYLVNIISGGLFAFGLVLFCQSLPRPCLGILVSLPYMVMIIAMGYTRQSIALGFVMLAIKSLNTGSVLKYAFWCFIAALFHKSAIVLIPLAILFSDNNKITVFFMVLITALVSYFLFLQGSVDSLYTNYVEAKYQSQGTLIRLVMCVIPSVIFLFCSSHFNLNKKEKKFWTLFSFISIVSCMIFFLTSSTTAIDRLALYLQPIQLMVLSHMPELFSKNNTIQILLLTIMYCFSVQFVWLHFAGTAFAWIPYVFYPFINL